METTPYRICLLLFPLALTALTMDERHLQAIHRANQLTERVASIPQLTTWFVSGSLNLFAVASYCSGIENLYVYCRTISMLVVGVLENALRQTMSDFVSLTLSCNRIDLPVRTATVFEVISTLGNF